MRSLGELEITAALLIGTAVTNATAAKCMTLTLHAKCMLMQCFHACFKIAANCLNLLCPHTSDLAYMIIQTF